MKTVVLCALLFSALTFSAYSGSMGSCQDCVILKGALQLAGEFSQHNPLHLEDIKNMKVVLNGGEYYGFINYDFSFEIHNVPQGKYILEVYSRLFHFETYIVEINSYRYENGERIDAYVFNPDTRKRFKALYPLKIVTQGKIPYFEKVEEMTIGSFVKNPYFFMIALSAVMLYFVNKMPSMEELQQEQQDSRPVQN